MRFLSNSNDITEPYGGTHPSLYLSLRALLLLSLTIFFDIGDCLKTKPISKKKVNYTQLRFLQKLSRLAYLLNDLYCYLCYFRIYFRWSDRHTRLSWRTTNPISMKRNAYPGPWRERSSNESLLAGIRAGPSIHLLTTYAITDPRTEPYLCYQNLLADTGYRKGFSWWVEISSLLLKVKNGVWLLVLVLKQNTGRTRRPQAGIFP